MDTSAPRLRKGDALDFHEEATAAFRAGETSRVRDMSEEALVTARATGDRASEVDALAMLSRVALRDGEFERVATLAQAAYEVALASGEEHLQTMPLHLQAVAERMKGDVVRARRLYEQSIALNKELGDEHMVTVELRNLAYVELHAGHPDRAKTLFKKAREEASRLRFDALLPYLITDAAVLAAEDDDPEGAARLLGAAEAAFDAVAQVPDPDDASELDRLRGRLIDVLGEDRLRAAHESGAALGPLEALEAG